MKKYKVGDTVHVVECGNLTRRHETARHYDKTITKVGRKYFYLDVGYGGNTAFHIDDGWQKSNYSSNYFVCESEQAYLDSLEANKINAIIRDNFSHYGRCKYSLAQLQAVAEILELEG